MSDYRETLELLIREAVRTMRNLNMGQIRPMQHRSGMPDIVREQAEAYGYTEASAPRFTPSAEQIDRLDALLVWLYEAPFESPEEARYLVWARGARVGWKSICGHLKCSRETAAKRHREALLTLGAFIWISRGKRAA